MLTFSHLNPIRFYKGSELPDYSNTFPHLDNVTQRVEYVQGLNPASWYKDWMTGKTLGFQFQTDDAVGVTIEVYKLNASNIYELIDSLLPTDITPIDWIGNTMLACFYTPTADGLYQFKIGNATSDVISAISSTKYSKLLVRIDYTNGVNDFACILENFTFTDYVTGQLVNASPEQEIEGFESDRGDYTKIQTTPKRIANLNINELHRNYIDHFNMVFSCNDIRVNGIAMQNPEAPSVELVDYSDLCNMVVKLQLKENIYSYDIS